MAQKYSYIRGDYIRLNEEKTGVLLDIGGEMRVYSFSPEYLSEYDASSKEVFLGEPVELTLDTTHRIRRILPALNPAISSQELASSKKPSGRQIVELLEDSLRELHFSSEESTKSSSTTKEDPSQKFNDILKTSNFSSGSLFAMAKSMTSDPVSAAILAATIKELGETTLSKSSEVPNHQKIQQSAEEFLKMYEILSKNFESKRFEATTNVDGVSGESTLELHSETSTSDVDAIGADLFKIPEENEAVQEKESTSPSEKTPPTTETSVPEKNTGESTKTPESKPTSKPTMRRGRL